MNYNIISSINQGAILNRNNINVFLNKKNISICKYLFDKGFISSYSLLYKKKTIRLFFCNYYEYKSILKVKQISKSGRRIYIGYDKLQKMSKQQNLIYILSTNKGICTNEEAITKQVGGELLFVLIC